MNVGETAKSAAAERAPAFPSSFRNSQAHQTSPTPKSAAPIRATKSPTPKRVKRRASR